MNRNSGCAHDHKHTAKLFCCWSLNTLAQEYFTFRVLDHSHLLCYQTLIRLIRVRCFLAIILIYLKSGWLQLHLYSDSWQSTSREKECLCRREKEHVLHDFTSPLPKCLVYSTSLLHDNTEKLFLTKVAVTAFLNMANFTIPFPKPTVNCGYRYL